jgi:hypothetical protein
LLCFSIFACSMNTAYSAEKHPPCSKDACITAADNVTITAVNVLDLKYESGTQVTNNQDALHQSVFVLPFDYEVTYIKLCDTVSCRNLCAILSERLKPPVNKTYLHFNHYSYSGGKGYKQLRC